MAKLSPMMEQYTAIKAEYQDCVLFYRLGDFYEMFFDDALLVSRELELTLTGRNYGQEEKAPMCGVPFHAAEGYIGKLIEKGYKVAICEQVEDPAAAKGLVKREVVRIITPGTLISGTMLSEKENNFLASIFLGEEEIGLAYCDLSTGELSATEFPSEPGLTLLQNELVRIQPREIILPLFQKETPELFTVKQNIDAYFNGISDGVFKTDNAAETIRLHFKVDSLSGLGLFEKLSATAALGGLFAYLKETQKQELTQFIRLKYYNVGNYMSLDKATVRNLELTETLYDKKLQGSLLGVLDKTLTAMGSRKLKKWVREPLIDPVAINDRLDGVQSLFDDVLHRNNIREGLKQVYDLERLSGRIAYGNANGRDLLALRNSLAALPEIKWDLKGLQNPLLCDIDKEINPLEEVTALIENSLVDEPPFTVKEGGLIREGYSKELDDLKASIKGGQEWIAGLEKTERERTGIKNLKVGFNRVFGYYIEITKSGYGQIPENYIRKQTLVNCERFITPELKDMEQLVLNAEAKINQFEYELFTALRTEIQRFLAALQQTSEALATLDVIACFAEVSSRLDYVKPEVNNEKVLLIEKGRHPVIEGTMENGVFVSNDTYIDGEDTGLLLITGPNMAGKSTYMRQTALIVLMAQMGCFVPCRRAVIGVADNIFTRIGASDNLAQGQSTFFVEMSELAYILNTSTSRSLIILDEIGRGTSTYDGVSIAFAVAEHLLESKHKARTLFATHYHELTVLEGLLPGCKNLNVDVAEENGNIVFLHKIVEGSASRSYGIHVAKLAGVPGSLLERAEEKLRELETDQPLSPEFSTLEREPVQMSFLDSIENPVIKKLKAVDLMQMSPWEALKLLEELQKAAL